jgi:tRNA dimethylallyltransferase
MQAIGYRHMVRYLTNACDFDTALRELQRDTRRYAKRQITWFKAEPEFIWVRPGDHDDVVERVRRFLGE